MVKLQDNKHSISDSEWEIMRVIWTLNEASSTQVITELQAKKDWTESTIKTLLRRLIDKGWLKGKRTGRKFIYHATVNQTEIMVKAAQAVLNRMCDMHKGEVLLKLLNDSPISQADLKKMAKLIANKQKTAPKMVPCNCLTKS